MALRSFNARFGGVLTVGGVDAAGPKPATPHRSGGGTGPRPDAAATEGAAAKSPLLANRHLFLHRKSQFPPRRLRTVSSCHVVSSNPSCTPPLFPFCQNSFISAADQTQLQAKLVAKVHLYSCHRQNHAGYLGHRALIGCVANGVEIFHLFSAFHV